MKMAIINSRGQMTARIGEYLSGILVPKGYDVLYDHGTNSGKIVSWFGEKYNRGSELSQVDIAIVEKVTDNVMALIEIEEKDDNPKKLLGDILGILIGNKIKFKGKRKLTVTKNTLLLVVGKDDGSHATRNKYIQKQVLKIKPLLSTNNSKIGTIIVNSFNNEGKLSNLLTKLFENKIP